MPNPIDDGIKPSLPIFSVCSRAGSKRLKNDAATMTPEAKPVNARCVFSPIAFLKKKTVAAPSVVPINGIIIISHISIFTPLI